MDTFIIEGGKRLRGEVTIGGSKNAALPILAATLLTSRECVLRSVPDIDDVHTMISLLKSLGAEVTFSNHTVRVITKRITPGAALHESACKMRASVLLLGPLLARTGRAQLPYPGGCVLGARPINTHIEVLKQLGVRDVSQSSEHILLIGKPRAAEVVMPEFSVTATENVILAACGASGVTHIRLAAVEPHIEDLCRFLTGIGVRISGIGTHTLKIHGGRTPLRGAQHRITPDYLEAGTFVLAAILTKGTVKVKNIVPHHLDAFWNLLRVMKVNFELSRNAVQIRPVTMIQPCMRLQTNVFPGFPTDLQPPFAVLLTQAHGKSFIHETLFEGRFSYFPDIIKMGARIKKVNSHEAIVYGPTALRGSHVRSWDIRAGAAMILAALVARGRSVVCDVHYIDRGYERFDGKLQALGACISRVSDEKAK